MESAFVKFAICVFVLFFQINQGLDKKRGGGGEKVAAQCFCKDFNLCLCIIFTDKMKKVNKQCLLDTPRTVRVSEKTWQVIVRTRRP